LTGDRPLGVCEGVPDLGVGFVVVEEDFGLRIFLVVAFPITASLYNARSVHQTELKTVFMVDGTISET
jgi:hypothetical protein